MNETLIRSPSDDQSIQKTVNESNTNYDEGQDDQSHGIEGVSLYIHACNEI